MDNIKKIVINDKMYDLDMSEENRISHDHNNLVYRLKKENIDLAVKFFGRNDLYREHYYEKAIEVAPKYYPVLLTNNLVKDEEENTVAITSPYIHSSFGSKDYCTTNKILFDSKVDNFFEWLHILRKMILSLSKDKISVFDCHCENITFGENKIHNLPYGLYIFDDEVFNYLPNYSTKTIEQYNLRVFNELISSIIKCYLDNLKIDAKIREKIIYEISEYKDELKYIKKSSSSYSTVREYMEDKIKFYQKRYKI